MDAQCYSGITLFTHILQHEVYAARVDASAMGSVSALLAVEDIAQQLPLGEGEPSLVR